MSEQKLTHWKKISHPLYIGAYELMDGGRSKELVVTIESVKREQVKGENGKEEECTVARLKGHKPFILNATNQKAITKALGTPYIEQWAGKSITLFVAKVKAFGDTVDCLRVRPEPPVIKLPELTPQHPKWNDATKALADKNTTMDQIKKSYTVSPENEKLLGTV